MNVPVNREEIKRAVIELIHAQAYYLPYNCQHPKDIREDMSLFDDLGLDSIDIVELTISLEEEFQVELGDEQMEGAKTVADVVNMIDELQPVLVAA